MYERQKLFDEFDAQKESTVARTERDIELYRKRNCRLQILRPDGTPVTLTL
ncbi:MAG: hypothetical protein IJC53_05350 [Clostridia bacterium]|nr:hypothetical protein [Clostridia bacterium]